MTTKSGEVYRVDLGMGAKVRTMLVVSQEDADAPRALSLRVPITSANRNSTYEVELPSRPFLRVTSFANVQGLQAIRHHEMDGPIGVIYRDVHWMVIVRLFSFPTVWLYLEIAKAMGPARNDRVRKSRHRLLRVRCVAAPGVP